MRLNKFKRSSKKMNSVLLRLPIVAIYPKIKPQSAEANWGVYYY